jgi:hypothetical protein
MRRRTHCSRSVSCYGRIRMIPESDLRSCSPRRFRNALLRRGCIIFRRALERSMLLGFRQRLEAVIDYYAKLPEPELVAMNPDNPW